MSNDCTADGLRNYRVWPFDTRLGHPTVIVACSREEAAKRYVKEFDYMKNSGSLALSGQTMAVGVVESDGGTPSIVEVTGSTRYSLAGETEESR